MALTPKPYPTISVVTCAYNSEAFLRQALGSVEVQTYPHIEHILNYSPSTDATLAILEEYMHRVGGATRSNWSNPRRWVWGMP
jgi:glycosyltransferase involved in cell wall biosynthesis